MKIDIVINNIGFIKGALPSDYIHSVLIILTVSDDRSYIFLDTYYKYPIYPKHPTNTISSTYITIDP